MKNRINILLAFMLIAISCKAQNIDNIIADYITNLKQFDVQNNKMILIEENFDDFYNKIMDKWKVYNQDQCIQAI
ncbi:hypothetical protein, partial [Tenacibaculum maritimum]